MSIGQQHMNARERLFKNLEPFPARNLFKRFLDYLMYGVGVLAPLALLPQILTIYSSHSAAGLSISTWVLLAVVNALWALYGLVHKSRQVFFANFLMTLFDLIIVFGILRY